MTELGTVNHFVETFRCLRRLAFWGRLGGVSASSVGGERRLGAPSATGRNPLSRRAIYSARRTGQALSLIHI